MRVRSTLVFVCFALLAAVPAALAQLPGPSLPTGPVPRSLRVTISAAALSGGTANLNGVPLGPITAYPDGTSLTLTAAPAPGSIFTGWSGACSGTGNCSVVMNGDKSVTASFRLPMLRVTKSGTGTGSVSGTVAGLSVVNCGSDCNESLLKGTAVSWSTTAGTGFPDGSSCAGGSTTVNGDITCDFRFTRPKLTVTKTGSGASAGLISGTGINCGSDCSEDYDLDTQVSLTATPASGEVVRSWSGGCKSPCTMTANRNVSIDMGKPKITVKITGSGGGGVTSNPAGLSCTTGTCGAEFTANTSVVLTADPLDNSDFGGWTGDCNGSSTTCTINNATKATASTTATFTRVYKLSASKVGEGTVTGGGLDCGQICSARLTNGSATVTLTATPAGGWTFKGWSGACNTLNVTCSLNMNSADRSVTATFTR